MHVELWAMTGNQGARVMCTIRAENGGVQIQTNEPVPPPILRDIEMQRGRKTDDAEFLKSLEIEFSGSYYRAKFISD
jgi:hypothetical protein